jgi:hypothetical protein
VLVNGVPLRQSLGLGQPLVIDDSKASTAAGSDPSIKGSFERVDAEQIIATFEMGKDFKGTPTITLIAPGRGLVLNSLDKDHLRVNGANSSLDESPYMFGKEPRPNDDDPKITDVIYSRLSKTVLHAVISGENLSSVDSVEINGRPCPASGALDKKNNYIKCNFEDPQDKKLIASLFSGESVFQSAAKDVPGTPKDDDQKPSINDYQTDATKLKVTGAKYLQTRVQPGVDDPYVFFAVTGSGFTDKMRLDQGTLVPNTGSEIWISIEKSKLPQVVTLIDDAQKVIARVGLYLVEPPKKVKGK